MKLMKRKIRQGSSWAPTPCYSNGFKRLNCWAFLQSHGTSSMSLHKTEETIPADWHHSQGIYASGWVILTLFDMSRINDISASTYSETRCRSEVKKPCNQTSKDFWEKEKGEWHFLCILPSRLAGQRQRVALSPHYWKINRLQ